MSIAQHAWHIIFLRVSNLNASNTIDTRQPPQRCTTWLRPDRRLVESAAALTKAKRFSTDLQLNHSTRLSNIVYLSLPLSCVYSLYISLSLYPLHSTTSRIMMLLTSEPTDYRLISCEPLNLCTSDMPSSRHSFKKSLLRRFNKAQNCTYARRKC